MISTAIVKGKCSYACILVLPNTGDQMHMIVRVHVPGVVLKDAVYLMNMVSLGFKPAPANC